MTTILVAGSLLAFGWLYRDATRHREDVRCGIVHVQDSWHADRALEECAASNVPRAQAYLGMLHWSASDRVAGGPEDWGLPREMTVPELQSEGLRLIETAAHRGDRIAQNELGLAYLDGQYGMPTDVHQASYWLRVADEGGDGLAPYNLARMHYSGNGLSRSQTEAEALLWRSALRGYKPAFCTLALIRDQSGNEWETVALRLAGRALDWGYPCAFDHSDVTSEFRQQE